MTVYLDVRTLFDLFCIGQGMTTVVWLWLQPKQSAHRWLAWLLVGLTLQVIDYFLSRSGIYYRHRWLYFTPLFFSFSFGFLLYGYIQARLNQPVTLRWYHFLPVIMQALFYVLLVFQSLDTKAWFWINVHKPYTRYLEYYLSCLFTLYYLYKSRKLVRPTDKLVGLRHLLTGAILFYIVALIDPLINSLYLSPRDPKFFLTAQILPLLVYSAALLGRGFSASAIQSRVRSKSTSALVVTDACQDQLRQVIQEKKLYQDPDLTLPSLAARLELTPNTLSRLINTGFQQSFTDFINGYRIDEVKRRLEAGDTERLTILGLALDAGFASKSTFNRVFKEQTGFTPKAYEKRCQLIIRDDERV